MQCINCEAWVKDADGAETCSAYVTELSKRKLVHGPGCVYTAKQISKRLEKVKRLDNKRRARNRDWERFEEDLYKAQKQALSESLEELGMQITKGAEGATEELLESLMKVFVEKAQQEREALTESFCRVCLARREGRFQKCFTCRRNLKLKDNFVAELSE